MDKIFELSGKKWEIDPSKKIVKKEELDALYDATQIIDKSNEVAKKIEEDAQKIYDERYKEGYDKGVEDGKQEYAFKMMEMVMDQVDALEGIEKQLVDVVIQSVEKIVGQINADDLITRIVRNGISSVRGEKRILVRVSLNQEQVVRNDLSAYLLSPDGRSGYIEVLGDSTLRTGDCVIETGMGVVQASLNSQLKILTDTLRHRVGNNKHGS